MWKSKVNLNDVFVNEKVSLLDNKFLNWDSDRAGIDLRLMGVKDDKLVFVSTYDWHVYEIDYVNVEDKGRLLGATLNDVMYQPEIVLTEAKCMTVEEIEKALGHKVIVKEEKW